MNFDLSKFKKVSSDNKSTELIHPGGHRITVAHKGLSGSMLKKLEDLPIHKFDGGDIEASVPVTQQIGNGIGAGLNAVRNKLEDAYLVPAYKAATSIGGGIANLGQGVVQGFNGQPATGGSEPAPTTPEIQAKAEETAPNLPLTAEQQQGQNNILSNIAGDEESNYLKGLQQQKAGVMKQAQAETEAGEKEAKLRIMRGMEQKAQEESYTKHIDEIRTEREHVMKDVRDGHIDPDKFFKDKSLFGQVSTGLGILISGLGSGIGGHPGQNVALDVLNKRIDQSIDAQKADLSNKNNYLGHLTRMMGDEKDAADMYRVLINDQISNKIQSIVASSRGPLAKANAQVILGKLNQDSAAREAEIARRKAVLSGAKVLPENMIRYSGLIPKEQQAEAFKELNAAKTSAALGNQLVKAFNDVNGKISIGGYLSHPIQNQSDIDSAVEPIIAQLSKETAGRYTEADSKAIKAFFPKIGDNNQLRAEKLSRLKDFIATKHKFSLIDSIGAGVPLNFSSVQANANAPANYKK